MVCNTGVYLVPFSQFMVYSIKFCYEMLLETYNIKVVKKWMTIEIDHSIMKSERIQKHSWQK